MVLRDKNLNLLPILLALLEEESVVRAADRVHLSQPAVSGALARLRAEFDDPLLVRSGRRMRRTNRADRLLPEVRQSCAELERLFEHGVFDPATAKASFVLAAPDHLAFALASELLPLLAEEAPGIEIHIVDASNELPRQLADGSVDLAIAGNFGVWTSLSYERLIDERFVAAMSSDHPLAGHQTLERQQIEEYASVSRFSRPLSPGSDEPVMTGVPLLDLDRQITVNQFVTAVLLSVGTKQVLAAPKMLVDRMALHLPIVGIPFEEEYSIEAGLFWDPANDQSPETLWLRSVMVRCLGSSGSLPVTPGG